MANESTANVLLRIFKEAPLSEDEEEAVWTVTEHLSDMHATIHGTLRAGSPLLELPVTQPPAMPAVRRRVRSCCGCGRSISSATSSRHHPCRRMTDDVRSTTACRRRPGTKRPARLLCAPQSAAEQRGRSSSYSKRHRPPEPIDPGRSLSWLPLFFDRSVLSCRGPAGETPPSLRGRESGVGSRVTRC